MPRKSSMPKTSLLAPNFTALVEANRELIVRMEAKIKAKLVEVWGETE